METKYSNRITELQRIIKENAEGLSIYIKNTNGDVDMDIVDQISNKNRDLNKQLTGLQGIDYTEIKIVNQFDNLREAIQGSAEVYGLAAYASSELDRSLKLHKRFRVQKYYLDEKGGIWYTVQIPHEPGRILHKFSWIGSLTAGSAAIAEIDEDSVRIFTKRRDRNDLRNDPNVAIWTTEYIR